MEDPFGVTVLALNKKANRLCIAVLRRTTGLAWAQSVPSHVRFSACPRTANCMKFGDAKIWTGLIGLAGETFDKAFWLSEKQKPPAELLKK